jgi:hypothetical protein
MMNAVVARKTDLAVGMLRDHIHSTAQTVIDLLRSKA